jgi:chemotaxis protein MotB
VAALARRAPRSTNIWPGFVDAMATLLLVLIFLLMVFVLAQAFLNVALSGRDEALGQLRTQVGELADLLSLERRSNTNLRLNVRQLSKELQSSVIRRDKLNADVRSLTLLSKTEEEKARELSGKLGAALTTIGTDRKKIETQIGKLSRLMNDVAALTALRRELEKKVAGLSAKVKESNAKVVVERKMSTAARAQVALLNQQMAALRRQLAGISQALEISERQAKEQGVQISSLGKRLNAALAGKVQELSRYRSEFFGRLRDILGRRKGVRIVGDRFVFQSEVLFASGSAELGDGGKKQLARLAVLLLDIAAKIPPDLNWILQVDGYTDNVPISNRRFASNWELSAARAISVVKFLKHQGVPAKHLAATGFGEYQPLDRHNDAIARRRNRRIELKLTQR